MTNDLDLASLLCSRICHDLISPVGAVGNGVELLEGAPGIDDDVRGLLDESARKALAALAYFRIAFGAAGREANPFAASELRDIATAYLRGGRHMLQWSTPGDDLQRPEAKLLLLMVLAGLSATPIGGVLAVRPVQSAPLALEIAATGRRAALSPEAEALMLSPADAIAEAPRDAHLALLGRHAAAMGVTLKAATEGETVSLSALEWAS